MQRLKTRNQFQAVLAGQTVARTVHFALHCVALDADVTPQVKQIPFNAVHKPLFAMRDVWIGAMVPKRWAKRAVTRNAIKRQIYSLSSSMEFTLPCAAHVVRLRAGFDKKKFVSATSDALKTAVMLELRQLFSKIDSVGLRAAHATP